MASLPITKPIMTRLKDQIRLAKNRKEAQLFRFQHAVALGRKIQDGGIYDVQVKALSELYLPED
jgi:hypothetical protein